MKFKLPSLRLPSLSAPAGSPSRPGRRRLLPLPAKVVAVLLVAITGLAVSGIFVPAIASRVPYVGELLSWVAPHLPPSVAWMHDEGTNLLRSGAYFGWSDGTNGELHLYGEGCSTEGDAAADQLVSLTLTGPAGRMEFPPNAVKQQWTDLDHARAHPHLQVAVATDRTLSFDRAALRCRSGREAQTRILATVLHVPKAALEWPRSRAPLAVDPHIAGSTTIGPYDQPRAVVNGPSSLPGIGQIAEFTLNSTDEPLSVLAVYYAPPRLATGTVLAAAGHSAALPYWRVEARPPNPATLASIPLPPLTPWHQGYQAIGDPQALRARRADAPALTIAPGEVGALFLMADAFRPTPAPRPILLKPVMELEHAGQVGALVTSGLAFGWTRVP